MKDLMTPEQRQIASLFFPLDLAARDRIVRDDGRFVHYTSAGTAFSIIQNKAIWMRNAMTMNDFSEIQHGKSCLIPAWQDQQIGGKLKSFLNGIRTGFSEELERRFDGWLPHFEQSTYFTCLSEHDPAEDLIGRLSMWRAYGGANGVALVMKRTPLEAATPELNAFSSSVAYLDREQFKTEFLNVIDNLIENRGILTALEPDMLMGGVFEMLRSGIIYTKHPGFREEREWRIMYSPTYAKSPAIEADFAVVRGVPQEIHKIPLVHNPEVGLVRADIPSLIDKIIIGPSAQPFTIYQTFVSLLKEAGVQDAHQRVIVSEIPLRN